VRQGLGMAEVELRDFLEKELSQVEHRSFYWESEESEDIVDLVVDLVAAAIAANNDAITQSLERASRGF
jgi:hypothetical protein